MGVIAETFETAITWDRFAGFDAAVRDGAGGASRGLRRRARSRAASPTSIPTAPAPYFTVLAPARRGDELAQWDEVKAAASEALLAAGGTITHHHAVGRDHRPWYDRQRPELFAAALRAAKAALIPRGSSTRRACRSLNQPIRPRQHRGAGVGRGLVELCALWRP